MWGYLESPEEMRVLGRNGRSLTSDRPSVSNRISESTHANVYEARQEVYVRAEFCVCMVVICMRSFV